MKAHRDEPMFLYFPMALTHGPLVATPGEPNAKGTLGRHRAMVRYMDKLIDALNELGLRDDTLVVWSTDNGTDRGITGRRHGCTVRGGKSMTAERGVYVPFIVNGPGRVPAGVTTDALVDFSDLLPTFCELAGARPPKGHVIDGRSFAPLVLGRSDDSERDRIFAMAGRNEAKLTDKGVQNHWWFRDRVMRDKRFKLYTGTDAHPEQLIDLQSDPFEQTNLLPAVSKDTKQALDRLYAQIRHNLRLMPILAISRLCTTIGTARLKPRQILGRTAILRSGNDPDDATTSCSLHTFASVESDTCKCLPPQILEHFLKDEATFREVFK